MKANIRGQFSQGADFLISVEKWSKKLKKCNKSLLSFIKAITQLDRMSVGLVISLGVKSFLKKNIFVILGNPLNRDKNFKTFFYQSIAFIHTKTLIPYSSLSDMCVRHSTALKSEGAKIGISPKPPP